MAYGHYNSFVKVTSQTTYITEIIKYVTEEIRLDSLKTRRVVLPSARDSFRVVSPPDSCMKWVELLPLISGGIVKFRTIPPNTGSSSILNIRIWSAKLKVLGEMLSP